MLLVALTGGLATGKTHVGAIFAELGCHLIDADTLGHESLASTGAAYAPTVAEFGTGILTPTGEIDRKAMAAVVFSQPDRLEKLNAIVHPEVERLRLQRVEAIKAIDPAAIIVVEAAIHIETGGYKRYQKLVLVVCSEEQQIERAMARDGSSREQVLARLARQMPITDKRKFADYVIDTSGTREETRRETVEVYNSLRGLEEQNRL